MVEAELGFRFKAVGIEETKSQMQSLFNQVQTGTISYQDFRSQIRPLQGEVRSVTQEANYMTGAWLASHPAILQVSQSMSILGSVANAVTAAMNTVNLAILGNQQLVQRITDIKVQLADAQVEYQRFKNAFGSTDPRTQAAFAKYNELLNQLKQAERDVAFQTANMYVSMAASWALIISNIAGNIPKIIALLGTLDLGENFAVALAAIPVLFSRAGTAAGIALDAGIVAGVVIGASILADQILSRLSPQWARTMNALQDSIIKSWGTDAFTAALIRPFVAAFIGWEMIAVQSVKFIVNVINGLVSAVNTVISAINNALGVHIPNIPLLQYTPPTPQQLAQGIGLNMGGSTSSVTGGQTFPGGINNNTNPGITSASKGTPSITITNVIQGSLIAQDNLNQTIDQTLKNALRNSGWTG